MFFEASEKLENKLTFAQTSSVFSTDVDISVHSVREVRFYMQSKMEPFMQSSGVHTIVRIRTRKLTWLISEGPLSGVEIKDPLFTKVDIARSLKAVIKYYGRHCIPKDYILAGVCRGVIVNSNVVNES